MPLTRKQAREEEERERRQERARKDREPKPGKDCLSTLPQEVLLMIYDECDPASLFNFSLVARCFHDFLRSKSKSEQIWKKVYAASKWTPFEDPTISLVKGAFLVAGAHCQACGTAERRYLLWKSDSLCIQICEKCKAGSLKPAKAFTAAQKPLLRYCRSIKPGSSYFLHLRGVPKGGNVYFKPDVEKLERHPSMVEDIKSRSKKERAEMRAKTKVALDKNREQNRSSWRKYFFK